VVWWHNLITIVAVVWSENELYQRHFISGMYARMYVCNTCNVSMMYVMYVCMFVY
jgi:hypothetical protein